MAAVTVGIFLILTKQKISLRSVKKELLLLLLSGAAMGFNWILLFEAYKYTTVSAATLSYYFAPVILIVISPLLFKERMSAKGVACFIASCIGLVMISEAAVGGKSDLIGIAFGLGAATLYATVMLLNKFIKGVTGLYRTFIQFISAIAVLLPYVALTSGFTVGNLDGRGVGALFVVGLVHTGITYCMYLTAIKELPGHEIALLSYVDPLVAVLVSVVWLNEAMTLLQIIGGALILGSTFLSELKIKKK
jgi:RarD protein